MLMHDFVMPVKPILKYMNEIESAFNKLESCYIERYEEEILTPDRVNIRIRARFSNGCILEWNESVITEGEKIDHLGYRYHFQDKDNKLIFRYDNTPHFPKFKTYPHHKHVPDNVIAVNKPAVSEVLNELKKYI
jgi:hypothetical protein